MKITINEKIRIKSNKIGRKRKNEEIYRKQTTELYLIYQLLEKIR